MSSRSRSALLALLAWPLAAAAQEPDLDELLARAAKFIAQYETHLDAVVAEERYRQESGPAAGPGGRSRGSLTGVRELESEFLLLYVPSQDGTAQWAGFRHVLRADGRQVSDGGRRRFDASALRRSTRETIAEWRRLNEESARYNVGPIGAINVPTLALTVVRADSQPQFMFRVDDAHDHVDGFDTVVLAYKELDPPTLVSDLDGEKVYASGRIWLTPEDGRVIRTELAVRAARSGLRMEVRITVRYGIDPQIEAWVPVQMEEEYVAGRNRVQGVARYTKYRWLDANR